MSSRLRIDGRVTASVLLGALALSSAGCGPAVPAKPTWTHDIRPILAAQCFRCHDGGGAPTATSNEKYKGTMGRAFPDQAAAEGMAALINTAVHGGAAGVLPMPPPPAQDLENWQLETIANWAGTLGK